MKRFIVFAAVAVLLSPALAFAQPRDSDRQDRRPGGKPDRPVTLPAPAPGKPGMGPGRPNPPGARPPGTRPPAGRPPAGRPPAMRPPNRPQFSWRGRTFNPVRGPTYRYPSGYGYRRWSIGAFLPALFLSTSYYYDDWRGLGIDAPPPGRRWVRYGPDLLLINLRTRRVEDVVYGVFY